jgi:hypothetical protein
MKKVILLALLVPLPAFGQIIENFESQNISKWVQSTEGHWKADTLSSLSGKFSLHHIFDNPDAGIDQIGIPAGNLHPSEGITKWSFLVKYGYDPSSLNNWSVFLMSSGSPSSMSADGATQGYAIGVNLTGSDDTLRLCKIDGNKISIVVNCKINWQEDIGTTGIVKISVERSKEGIWNVSVNGITGNLIHSSSGTDSQLFAQCWFGIFYRYSSTRDRLLWLDDINIEGVFYDDTVAPKITRCEAAGKNSADIIMDEEPAAGIMIPGNILLNNGENKTLSVVKINNLIYRVNFAGNLLNRSTNTLEIERLCDHSNNCTENVKADFTPSWAETGDVVISEIMADPSPVVSLPDKEYIEITNRRKYPFNLTNWKLVSGTSVSTFPGATLSPSGILILCSEEDTLLFKKYGRVLGMKQFPVLTDGGKILGLSDSTGNLIHGVEYSRDWYKDDLKANGGWSLEMIDPDYPFYSGENWRASESKTGGTPGEVNSVLAINQDVSFYGIQNVFAEDSVTVHIWFSEPVLELNKSDIFIGEKPIAALNPDDLLSRSFTIKLGEPIERGQLYTFMTADNISDFAGNILQHKDFKFGLSDKPAEGDILFNEILFNPYPGDPDYLELYNCSEKVIDAARLQLVSVNDESGSNSDPVIVSDETRCILPGEYYAITTDPKDVLQRYPSSDAGHLFKTGSLPSMPDDKGHLMLFSRELGKIDELKYSKDMHYALLSDIEGVALEKINPLNRSQERSEWHSATESSGWGTPGAPNSVFTIMPEDRGEVTFSSTRITPDGDGYEDFLTINIKLKGNGNVVSITIFDEAGSFVRKLTSNLFSGAEASVIWDGTTADGSPVNTGIYIFLITTYNDTGKTEKWKKVVTVLRK